MKPQSETDTPLDSATTDTPRTERLLATLEREKQDIWHALKAITEWARGLERECASLEAHLVPSETGDSARLDWLETLPCGITINADRDHQAKLMTRQQPGYLRDFIDAARKERSGPDFNQEVNLHADQIAERHDGQFDKERKGSMPAIEDEGYPYRMRMGEIADAKGRCIIVPGNLGVVQLLNTIVELRHEIAYERRWREQLQAIRDELVSATGAIAEVSAERRRQIDEEGWDAEHDDEHPAGNLSAAAACYAAGVQLYDEQERNIWPWEERWWKPKDQRRNLIRAAALIIAEIEKLDRKTQYVNSLSSTDSKP